jgi:ankyrin repeat protein
LNPTLPKRPDLDRLKDEARALHSRLQAADPEAVELARKHDPNLVPPSAQLADAQRILARHYGFPSWPRLKAHVELPKLTESFQKAVNGGNADELDRLLREHRALRDRIDEPLFAFDSPAIVVAARYPTVVEVLLRHGADPNARSEWWAGSFSALDFAPPETLALLLDRGGKFDVWSASAQGRVEELRAILDETPEAVNAPGGDGMRPLHFATTVEVAKLLLDRGADPNLRDTDHEGTAVQHQIERPEIARLLVEHGGEADIYILTALEDDEGLRGLLRENPELSETRIGQDPYVTKQSDGGHIYAYKVGNGRTPLHFAIHRGLTKATEVLLEYAQPSDRLVAACLAEDRDMALRIVGEHQDLVASLTPDLARALPDAAAHGKQGVVQLMLELGFDPLTKGMDSGTALHIAAWYGHASVVELVVGTVPIELRDDVHGSTPLGWAAHGAHWCRNASGDYPRVVELLLAAGADISAPANGGGTSILEQAGNRDDVKAVLRRHGAR